MWQVALGTAGEQAKPCQCPPTFPAWHTGSSAYSPEQCPMSHVPCAWKRELGAKDLLSTLGCGCLPRQHSKELLRPGWLQGRLQGSCTAGKGNDQQLKPMKGKKLLHKTKSHISEHAMPSKHPQSSQILALFISKSKHLSECSAFHLQCQLHSVPDMKYASPNIKYLPQLRKSGISPISLMADADLRMQNKENRTPKSSLHLLPFLFSWQT